MSDVECVHCRGKGWIVGEVCHVGCPSCDGTGKRPAWTPERLDLERLSRSELTEATLAERAKVAALEQDAVEAEIVHAFLTERADAIACGGAWDAGAAEARVERLRGAAELGLGFACDALCLPYEPGHFADCALIRAALEAP